MCAPVPAAPGASLHKARLSGLCVGWERGTLQHEAMPAPEQRPFLWCAVLPTSAAAVTDTGTQLQEQTVSRRGSAAPAPTPGIEQQLSRKPCQSAGAGEKPTVTTPEN